MNPLSAMLQSLSPSETFAMAQKSNELKAQGIDVINMSVGEPDFATPDHIKEAAKKAIDNNFSFYSPVPGFPELRKAVVAKLKNENDLDFDISQIVVSSGAKQSLCNVILSIVDKGEEVIIPAPYWVSYPEMVKIAEGKSVFVYAGIEQDYKITAKQLEEAITPKTKALILCSPSNPTGSVYTREELKSLAEVLAKHPNIYVISDEIYEHINYVGKHESMAQFPEIRERVIVVNGVSKGYAMTGWRIGWIAAPKWIASACGLLQGQYTSGASSISQKAAEAAYTGDQACVQEMRTAFERRKNLITKLLKEIPGLRVNDPKGAFYTFVECSHYVGKHFEGKNIETATDLAMYLLEQGHVACVGGDAFGAPGHIRFSYATSDENIEKAVSRVKNALAKLT
ncbi:pyridoxal phosphate-dependent aminotransferase [Petrimonas sp.]|uniref:pyridoxal phosphate-dependent aminotransferase n=1 Tax=Petrimonas sp. TaxID=2023866 RepID=UPI003F519AA8